MRCTNSKFTSHVRSSRKQTLLSNKMIQSSKRRPVGHGEKLKRDRERKHKERDEETDQQRSKRQAIDRKRHKEQQSRQTPEERAQRLKQRRERRAKESEEHRRERQAEDRRRHKNLRDNPTPQQRSAQLAQHNARNEKRRQLHQQRQLFVSSDISKFLWWEDLTPPEKELHPQELISAVERRYTTPPAKGKAVAFVSKSGFPVWWCNKCACFWSHLTEDHGCCVTCSHCMRYCKCECDDWDECGLDQNSVCFYCLRLTDRMHCKCVDCLDEMQRNLLRRLRNNAHRGTT